MPLYIKDAYLDQHFTGGIKLALERIREVAAGQALNPDIAVTQIRLQLDTAFPPEHSDILKMLRPATWNGIYQASLELLYRCRGLDEHLVMLATALQVIHNHSVSPPRQLVATRHMEVRDFFELAQLSRYTANVVDIEGRAPTSLMFTFCRYCWRQTIPFRHVCPLHATGRYVTADTTELNSTRHKSGQRQLKSFERTIDLIVTSEVNEFHLSQFQVEILFRPTELGIWLESRRPFVWRTIMLSEAKGPTLLMDQMLAFLYDVNDVMQPVLEVYERAKFAIRENPVLAWPMVTRMEAFLRSRQLSAVERGGKRAGAGRKPKTLPLSAEPSA